MLEHLKTRQASRACAPSIFHRLLAEDGRGSSRKYPHHSGSIEALPAASRSLPTRTCNACFQDSSIAMPGSAARRATAPASGYAQPRGAIEHALARCSVRGARDHSNGASLSGKGRERHSVPSAVC